MGTVLLDKSFYVGVLSSIVAVFVLFLFRKILTEFVGIILGTQIQDISGTWYTCLKEKSKEYREIVHLKQIGRRIWGDITLQNGTKEIKYKFEGVFRDRILYASFSSIEKKNYEVGTFTLLYKKQGVTWMFQGHTSFCSKENSDRIESSTYKWSRERI